MKDGQRPLIRSFLSRSFTLLLYLCPRSFRAEFEEEMTNVFARAMAEEASGGWRRLFRLIGVEFSALPVLVISEWWSYFRKKEQSMNQARIELPPEPAWGAGRAGWSAVVLAALPHLLLSVIVALPAAPILTPPWLGALYYFAMLAVMAIALLGAWRGGWPLWSGSWAGYWLLLPYVWIGSIIPWRPGLDYLLALPPLAVGLLLFIRRPIYGLLASVAPFLLITRVFVFELFTGGELVWSGIWLLLAVTSGATVWLGTVRAGVLFVIAFQFVTGLIFAIARAYLPYRSPTGVPVGPRTVPELTVLVNDFAPLTLAAITLPLAPLLLHPLGRLANRGGHPGRSRHRLLLLGMALTFGGFFILRARPSFVGGASRIMTAATVAGLTLSLGSAIFFIRSIRSGLPGLSLPVFLVPLLASFAPLVVFSLPRPFPTAGQYGAGFQVQLALSYLGVLTWAALAIFILAGGRGGRKQLEMTIEAVPG